MSRFSRSRRNNDGFVPTDGIFEPRNFQKSGLPLDHDTPSNAIRNVVVPELITEDEAWDLVGYCRLVAQDMVKQGEPIDFATFNLFALDDFCNSFFSQYVQYALHTLAGEMLLARRNQPNDDMMYNCCQYVYDLLTLDVAEMFSKKGLEDEITTREFMDSLDGINASANKAEDRMNEYLDYEQEELDTRGRDYDDYDTRGRSNSRGSRMSRSVPSTRERGGSKSRMGSFRGGNNGRNDRGSERAYSAPATYKRRDRDIEREERQQARRNQNQTVSSQRFPNGKKPTTERVMANTRPTQNKAAHYTGPSSRFGNKQRVVDERQYDDYQDNTSDFEPDEIVIVDGCECRADTRPGTVIGETHDGLAIVFTHNSLRNAKRVDELNGVEEERYVDEGPTEVVKFGGSEGVVRQEKDTTMNEGRTTYNRNNRSVSETRDGVKTTRYDRDEPALDNDKPVPASKGDIVIDPFYFGKPTFEDRPFDEFFNPGGILIFSRQHFLRKKQAKTALLDWKKPLEAFNPYTHVAFVAIFPNGKLEDIVVPVTKDMDYLTHELRGELRAANRLRLDGIVKEDQELPTYTRNFPQQKTDLTADEATSTFSMVSDLEIGDPMAALTIAEQSAAKATDGNTIPANLVYTTVMPLDIAVVGKSNMLAVKSLKDCNTFVEVATRLVQLRNDDVISLITFNRIDALLKEHFNRLTFDTYGSNMRIGKNVFFVDAIEEAVTWLKGAYGTIIERHFAEKQHSLIAQLFDLTLIDDSSEPKEEESDWVETNVEDNEGSGFVDQDAPKKEQVIFPEDTAEGTEEAVEAQQSIDQLLKEELELSDRIYYLRSTMRTVVAKVNLSSSAFGSVLSDTKGGEVLPQSRYPYLTKLLSLCCTSLAKNVRTIMITTDGKQYDVSVNYDNISVVIAKLN